MGVGTYTIGFDGSILRRGFWIYLWEVKTAEEGKFYYVGRTGDSSSVNAQSPFNRMSNHLNPRTKSNMLRRHLEKIGIQPEACNFRMMAFGPILQEVKDREEHMVRRDAVAAIEKEVASDMSEAGYHVLNTVNSLKPLDRNLYAPIRSSLEEYFPALSPVSHSDI